MPEPAGFAEFYQLYPRHVARRSAAKAFAAALKRASVADIMAGLLRYRFSPDVQYQPHPATWLNGDRWLDDPAAFREPMGRHERIRRAGGLPTFWGDHEAPDTPRIA